MQERAAQRMMQSSRAGEGVNDMKRGDPDGVVNQRGETRRERAQRLENGEKKLAAILAETAASYEEVDSLLNGAKKWLYVTDRPPEGYV